MDEQSLILSVLAGDAPSPQIRRLAAQIDWEAILTRLLPNLHPYFAHQTALVLGLEAVPPGPRRQLEAALRAGSVSALRRLAALRRLSAAFTAESIPALLLKGMALAHQVYPDPALRPMQDLDVWVPAERLDDAARTLTALGYRFPQRKYRGQSQFGVPERTLELPGTPILIELQAAPASLTPLPAGFRDRAWARSRVGSLGGIPARVLHPEDQLIHLALHAVGYHRLDTGLLPLIDVQLTIQRWKDDWDWATMARDYHTLGVAGCMYLTLSLTRETLAAPVPDRFFGALPVPPGLEEMQALAREQLWAANARIPRALERGLGGTTFRGRTGWLFRRFTSYYAADLPASGAAAAGEIARRVLHDLRVKIPRYARGWLRGELRGAELRRRTALARGRERLTELLTRTETALKAP